MHDTTIRYLRKALIGMASTSAIVLACSQAQAKAQDASSSSSSSSGVETVVVTAEKHAENIQKVPISITAFSSKDIENLGMKSSTDFAQYTPNVYISLPNGVGNQPVIIIRGIGLNDYDTNNAGPNGVYIDEVYQSSPSGQTFQTFDLKRIEVLKGPQGTLYGRNSSGGAINYITKKPTDYLTGNLHAEYSSFNTVNLEGAVGGPLSKDLDGRIAGVYNYSDGYSYNELTHEHVNGTNNMGVRGELQYKPSEDLTILFNVHGGYLDNLPYEYRHVGTLVPGTFDPATFSYSVCSPSQAFAGNCVDMFGYNGTNHGYYNGGWQRKAHLRIESLGSYLRADYKPGNITYTSITAFEYNDKRHPEDSDSSPNSLVEVDFNTSDMEFTQEFRASQSTNTYDWVVGAYYLHEVLKQNQPLYLFLDWDKFFGAGSGDGLASINYFYARQATDAYALYGQGDYRITPKLKLTLGGRYTIESKTYGMSNYMKVQSGGEGNFGPLALLWDYPNNKQTNYNFSYKVALNYNFTNTIMAYVSLTTGFKGGDFDGGFLDNNPVIAKRELAPVKPETVTAYEAGLKTTLLHDRLLFDFAAFYNDWKNEQLFTWVDNPEPHQGPLNVLDNAPKAHTDGLEVQLVARPINRLTLSADFGFLFDAKVDKFLLTHSPVPSDYTNHRLPFTPKFTFSGVADYVVPLANDDQLNLQFTASYRASQYGDLSDSPYTAMPSLWLENIRVGYTFDEGRWEISGYITNLSGQKYVVNSGDLTNPFGFIQQIVGTPRVFGGALDYRF